MVQIAKHSREKGSTQSCEFKETRGHVPGAGTSKGCAIAGEGSQTLTTRRANEKRSLLAVSDRPPARLRFCRLFFYFLLSTSSSGSSGSSITHSIRL